MSGSMWAGTLSYSAVERFSKYSKFPPVRSRYLNITDRRMIIQTTNCGITVLCIVSYIVICIVICILRMHFIHLSFPIFHSQSSLESVEHCKVVYQGTICIASYKMLNSTLHVSRHNWHCITNCEVRETHKIFCTLVSTFTFNFLRFFWSDSHIMNMHACQNVFKHIHKSEYE